MRRPQQWVLSLISIGLTIAALATVLSRPPYVASAQRTPQERLAVVESQSSSNNTSLVAILAKMDAIETRIAASEKMLASWNGRADIISWLMAALLGTGAIQLALHFKK